ncbi:hypothetical protein D3C84_946920 [compost metagenome]
MSCTAQAAVRVSRARRLVRTDRDSEAAARRTRRRQPFRVLHRQSEPERRSASAVLRTPCWRQHRLLFPASPPAWRQSTVLRSASTRPCSGEYGAEYDRADGGSLCSRNYDCPAARAIPVGRLVHGRFHRLRNRQAAAVERP